MMTQQIGSGMPVIEGWSVPENLVIESDLDVNPLIVTPQNAADVIGNNAFFNNITATLINGAAPSGLAPWSIVSTNLLPPGNIANDIGSTTHQLQNLYVGQTIYGGNASNNLTLENDSANDIVINNHGSGNLVIQVNTFRFVRFGLPNIGNWNGIFPITDGQSALGERTFGFAQLYLSSQNAGLGVWAGTGVPASGLGANGDYYLRADGAAANTHIYFKAATIWTGIV